MRYWPGIIAQLLCFWLFMALYVICIVPLAVVVAWIGEGERG